MINDLTTSLVELFESFVINNNLTIIYSSRLKWYYKKYITFLIKKGFYLKLLVWLRRFLTSSVSHHSNWFFTKILI